jgi:two-component system, LuxR family, response regulator FixJ
MTDQQQLVLVIDHDQAIRDSLEFALRLEGFRVRVHGDAIGLLADPDLPSASCIVLDDRTSHLDGFDILRHMHARAIRPPAILLASRATPGLRARASAAGIGLVLEKPLLGDDLVNGIRTVMDTNGC